MERCFHPYIKPTGFEAALLRELVGVAARCYERGWTAGTAGNFSLRVHPNLMWISQSGVCKGELRWDRFIPLDIADGIQTIEANYRKPSDESALHAAILRQVPTARAVVHVHPQSIVSASLRPNGLEFEGLEMEKALGIPTHAATLSIPVVDNTQDIVGLAQAMKLQSNLPVLMLRGHGVYAWGSTPQQALNYVEGLDHLCAVTQS
jgi:methylthioribulose-1-phosphate dehydratase